MSVGSALLRMLLAMSCVWPQLACADEGPAESPVRFRGFGTFALARSTDDKAAYIAEIAQPHGIGTSWTSSADSVLGAQVNARFSPEVEGVVQAVSRLRNDGSYKPSVSWAFVRYMPDPAWDIRVGRVSFDALLLVDARNVGYSFPWVRLPPDLFTPNTFTYLDGFDLVWSKALGPGILRTKFQAGTGSQELPVVQDRLVDLKRTEGIGLQVEYQTSHWLARVGAIRTKFKHDLPLTDLSLLLTQVFPTPGAIALDQRLRLAGASGLISSAALAYDNGPFQWQGTINRIDFERGLPTYTSAYSHISYRLAERFTPFLTISRIRSDPWDLNSPYPNTRTYFEINALISGLAALNRVSRRTTSVGVRYDFARNADLKFQVDRVHANPDGWFLNRDVQPGWTGRSTIYSVAVDFVF